MINIILLLNFTPDCIFATEKRHQVSKLFYYLHIHPYIAFHLHETIYYQLIRFSLLLRTKNQMMAVLHYL